MGIELIDVAALAAPQAKHADNYPPSAAARWLSCPASPTVVKLYDNDESDASLKGDTAHDLLENGILFGIRPDTDDPDMDLNIMGVLAWVNAQREAYGKECKVFAECKYDIPETGEWGTADVTFVSPQLLHIADYKNGFVPVEVDKNAQMLTYLLGAIAKHGERKHYRITILQPNYDHRDGPYRTMEVSHELVEWFRNEIKYSMQHPDEFKAGKHCKKTYCPHRGSCESFMAFARTDARAAFWPHDVHALDDVQLSQALDHSDTLQGLRDELRKEAMRRIMHNDKQIPDYKVVKSRVDRSFAGDAGKAACYLALLQMGYTEQDLCERTALKVGDITVYEQKPLTVAGVERMVKQKYKIFGQGKWKEVWEQYFAPHVRTFSGSLTLTRTTDGRPSHSRGSEFGALKELPAQQQVGQVI